MDTSGTLQGSFERVLADAVAAGTVDADAAAALTEALLRQVAGLLTERQRVTDARGEPEAAYELRYVRDALLRTEDRRWYAPYLDAS